MFRGLAAVTYKESRHILRDFRTLFLMLIVPALQLTIFGYAINLDVENIPTVVYNMDGRDTSHELLETFANTRYFHLRYFAQSDDEMLQRIVRGEAGVGIKIPPDYTDKVFRKQPVAVQILIDGSDSTVAMQALNVSNAITLRESVELVAGNLRGDIAQLVESRPRVLFNPDMRTANFMVPGLVGIILQLVTMLLTAFAIVREKEQGTLEQLMVTPVSRLGLILGKLLPYSVVGAVETISVLVLMYFLFGVPVAGSLLHLAFFTVFFLFTTLGLGLLISTFAANQIQALQLSFLVILPSVLLSGFIFPQESMPYPIYVIGQCIPVTYFIRILRGIILRGAGFEDLWFNGALLAAMGLFILAVATLRFRKKLA